MTDENNEGLEVVATLTVSFDEGDGGSAIEQVETHMLLDEGAHGLCRHSEAIAGYAVRDARIAAQEAQIKVLQSNANSWQSGYDEGRRMGGKHCMVTVDQLRAELAAIRAQEPVIAYLVEGMGTVSLHYSAYPEWAKGDRALTVTPLYAAPVAKQVVMPAQLVITNTLGFGFLPGELQTVNADDLLRLVSAARPNAADQEGGV